MSTQINQELKASGVAQVLVVVKTPDQFKQLESHFSTSELSQASALAAGTRSRPQAVRYYKNLGVALGTVDRAGLTALKASDAVASVTGAPPLSLIRPTDVQSASLSTQNTWGIRLLGIPALWAQGLTGQGVLVGHLDTGADGNHPALQGAISSFAEFDMLGRQVNPAPSPYDTDDHGTHTAATIAGRAVNGRAVGVAPGATLASAIVIEGGQVIARVLGGMDWAVGKGVKVLSMSLGFRGWWDDFLPLTRILRSKNILPVFAVGNEGPGTSRSPGNYWQATSIGACDEQLSVASFSSSQRFVRSRDPIVPDLVGPGVGVISAKPGGGYQSMSGTSMATPHIAGLAALLWQAKPNAKVNRIERAIFRACSLGTMIQERAGRGFPAALKALEEL